MKKLLVIGITSLLLFILSASTSYFWQQKQKNVAATDTAGNYRRTSEETAKPAPAPLADVGHDDSPPRATVRPADNPGTEEIARMTSEPRSRLASVREREEQLTAQKKMIELIQKDIRGERTALDELRSQIKSELEALNKAVEAVEKQRSSLDEERQKISKATQEMEARVVQLPEEEQDNLKKMSGMYNSMSPEVAAEILQNLADTGKMDTAVKVLGQMEESQAAKVLAELTDADLAAQLDEKLKSLRRIPASSSEPRP